jgi:nucleotide-binding universal stress UspA family protein
MKNLLISTDFSANATHAAEYGYAFAKQIRANIFLCNAVIVPAEIPSAGTILWPQDEFDILMEESSKELASLKEHLEGQAEHGFQPQITCVNETGRLYDIVNDLVSDHDIDLVILGTHGNTGLGGWLLGNHCRTMVEAIRKPLLLVPPKSQNFPIRKIALAVDFKEPEKDLESIYDLIPFARPLNAEILLTHVYNGEQRTADFKKRISQFLTDISNKADYPHIYYRILGDTGVENGLDWLCEVGQVDVLAMVHHKHGFFDNLLNGSYTKRMADQVAVPLLVIPGKY